MEILAREVEKLRKVRNLDGDIIGNFDWGSVKSEEGIILYRVTDGEVYQPIEYPEKDLQFMNKGQMICVGTFSKNNAVTTEGDLLFKVS